MLVDADGSEVAFDPSAPTPAAAQIDAIASLDAIACPSMTQCTAVDDAGNEVTFDPHSPGSPVPHAIAGGVMLQSVACPSTSECVATYAGTGTTHEITFDPVSPGTPRAVKIDSEAGQAGSAPYVACPTTSQCTAMSSFRDYTDWDTFNPTSPATVTKGSVAQIDAGFAGDAVAGLSCPSSRSCVVISGLGYVATFNPSSTSGAQVLQLPDDFGGGLACPSTSQCSTIAVQGALTFNPASPASAPPPVAAGGGGTAIACPATTFCAAPGAGGVVEGDPTTGSGFSAAHTVAGAEDLRGIDCAAVFQCVVVDSVGQAFLGIGPGAPVPGNSSPPTISGSARQGQTLHEQHGVWSNSPTSFSFQWEDCDSAGNNCQTIANATGPDYPLVAGDVGDTVRVVEVARNAFGDGLPAVSAPSAAVLPVVLQSRGPPQISGTTVVGQTLTETHGTWSGAPSSFTYQWERCDAGGINCQAIAGAVSASYVLTNDDVGHTLRVLETASDAGGAGSPASSGASGIVIAPPPPPAVKPANQTVPAITGAARVGQKLTASAGTWTGSPPIVFSHQWERCHPGCSPIQGARSTAYTPIGADQGDRLAVIVTASNSAGSSQTLSAQTGAVAAAGPTPGQVTSAVAAALGVSGHAASIGAILKAGGYTTAFAAPAAGAFAIGWYQVPPGAHVSKARTPILIASAHVVFHRAGKAKVHVRLNRAGRSLLSTSRRVTLTEKASYSTTSTGQLSRTRKFTLHR